MRTLLAPLGVGLLCLLLARADVQAQGKGDKKQQQLQALLANGNQALGVKNCPLAIPIFQQAVHFCAKYNGARASLTKAQKALHAAQDAFSKDTSKGKTALGKKDFKGALVALTAAAQ